MTSESLSTRSPETLLIKDVMISYGKAAWAACSRAIDAPIKHKVSSTGMKNLANIRHCPRFLRTGSYSVTEWPTDLRRANDRHCYMTFGDRRCVGLSPMS